MPDDTQIEEFLIRSGLIAPAGTVTFEPLTGGVSSDIWKVGGVNGAIVVKRALAKLRVVQDWRVPTSRNACEVAWLKVAGAVVPDAAPRILAHDPDAGLFAMEFLDPRTHPVWKAQLSQGIIDLAIAGEVGRRVGAIHAATAHSAEHARRFANDGLFHDIRLEPYVEATAQVHRDLAEPLLALSKATLATHIALVHGDVSPKNILIGPRGPIFLDAECAWFGDPAFDLAFCLNHLLLKCLWTAEATAGFLAAFDRLAESYLAMVSWEPVAHLEARSARLLPALFLARIDGKSPVEYVTDENQKERVRRVARPLIANPPARLQEVRQAWERGSRGERNQNRDGARSAGVGQPRQADGRGRIRLAGGASGRAIAPAGASTGSGEAVDRRDGGNRLGGMDVRGAVEAVNGEIAIALVGKDAADEGGIDALLVALDGTPNKRRLGGNALIATSMATLQAAAAASHTPLWRHLAGDRPVSLPLPEIQIFGGGAHAAGRVDVQDFMVMCIGADSFSQALDWTAEIYRAAGARMKASGRLMGVADEGGYWPAFKANEDALDELVGAIESAGLKPGRDVAISLDIAASEFGREGRYRLALEDRALDTAGMIDMLGRWLDAYPIVSVEDPLAEDDAEGFRAFTAQFGARCQVIGDDLLVTNAKRVREAATSKAVTAVLIKPNQAGTISETKAALDAAREHGLATIVSARSGESEDVTIAHLAIGWNAGQLKVGSFSRSERMAKWNECLRIEEALGADARFAGRAALGLRGEARSDLTK